MRTGLSRLSFWPTGECRTISLPALRARWWSLAPGRPSFIVVSSASSWFHPSYKWINPTWLVVWNHGILWLSIQLGIIIPTDFHIFQRGRYTTNQLRLKSPGKFDWIYDGMKTLRGSTKKHFTGRLPPCHLVSLCTWQLEKKEIDRTTLGARKCNGKRSSTPRESWESWSIPIFFSSHQFPHWKSLLCLRVLWFFQGNIRVMGCASGVIQLFLFRGNL